MASMAKALGIAVVAEGIEAEEQATELLKLGCERDQGFLFAPPLTAEEVPALIASRAPAAA